MNVIYNCLWIWASNSPNEMKYRFVWPILFHLPLCEIKSNFPLLFPYFFKNNSSVLNINCNSHKRIFFLTFLERIGHIPVGALLLFHLRLFLGWTMPRVYFWWNLASIPESKYWALRHTRPIHHRMQLSKVSICSVSKRCIKVALHQSSRPSPSPSTCHDHQLFTILGWPLNFAHLLLKNPPVANF